MYGILETTPINFQKYDLSIDKSNVIKTVPKRSFWKQLESFVSFKQDPDFLKLNRYLQEQFVKEESLENRNLVVLNSNLTILNEKFTKGNLKSRFTQLVLTVINFIRRLFRCGEIVFDQYIPLNLSKLNQDFLLDVEITFTWGRAASPTSSPPPQRRQPEIALQRLKLGQVREVEINLSKTETLSVFFDSEKQKFGIKILKGGASVWENDKELSQFKAIHTKLRFGMEEGAKKIEYDSSSTPFYLEYGLEYHLKSMKQNAKFSETELATLKITQK